MKMEMVISSIEIMRAYSLVKILHENIIKMMIKSDGKMNYHDCLISLVMKEKGLPDILTLDKGFLSVPWINVIS